MTGIRNWGFVLQHMAVAVVFAAFTLIVLMVLGWWGTVAAVVAAGLHTLFWFGREVWDHEGLLGVALDDPQVLAEWLAPSITFAFIFLIVGVLT